MAQFGNEMGFSEENPCKIWMVWDTDTKNVTEVVHIFRKLKHKNSGLAFVAHQENIVELQRRFFFSSSVYILL